MPTPKSEGRRKFYTEVTNLIKDAIREAEEKMGILVIGQISVAMPGVFINPKGGAPLTYVIRVKGQIAHGSAFDLGADFPTSIPEEDYEFYMGGNYSFTVMNDGVAQFRYGVEDYLRDDEFRPLLTDNKIAIVSPGTGLGG